MDATRVDPAALLIAVLAVGVNTLTQDGEWEPINTIIGGTVLLIIVPYVFAKGVRSALLSEGPRLPLAVAIGVVLGVSSAWPIQAIWDRSDDDPSYIALAVAGGVALILWTVLTLIARKTRASQTVEAAAVSDAQVAETAS